MTNLIQVANSLNNIALLRHIHQKLYNHKISEDIATVFDFEMLTMSFIILYCRIQEGGTWSGISRNKIPIKLRNAHDNIIELRNKRYAHNANHDSLDSTINVDFYQNSFRLDFTFRMIMQFGGGTEWPDLVRFFELLLLERQSKILNRLKLVTGNDWIDIFGPISNKTFTFRLANVENLSHID